MKSLKLFEMFVGIGGLVGAAFAQPVRLRCEYRQNPLGIDSPSPHLSWQSDSSERNWKQSAYQILVASSVDALRSGQTDVWDSGKTSSDESVDIAYEGPPLESRKRYYWKVRVWDASGNAADSSEDAWWEMGLLHPQDWKAKWIRWENPEDAADRNNIRWIWAKGQDALAVRPKSSTGFRVHVDLLYKPLRAVLLIVVRGDYVARVNGIEVGSKHDWNAFDLRDIVDELKLGDNVVEITVTAPQVEGSNAATATTKAALAALRLRD